MKLPESFSLRQIVGLMGMGFFALASYAVARPAIESLFLSEYQSKNLPKVWLAVAVVAVVVTTGYTRVASSMTLARLYRTSVGVSCLVLVVLLGLSVMEVPGAVFSLYIWKEVYVVVLLECLWTIANASFAIGSARWLYGVFCIVGSLGGLSGNLLVGHLAEHFGTDRALWFVIPLLVISGLSSEFLDSEAATLRRSKREGGSFTEGWIALRQSRYLLFMLGMIATIQVVITLVDYQFNAMVEQAYPDTDARTAAFGYVYAAIDSSALGLQLLTGPILVSIGVRGTLLGIPVIIGGTLLAFAISPVFLTMAVAKVAGKCFDYSIFRAAKEILYIPLNFAEKTQGKALVDIMTYRVAKGAASFLLMGLGALGLLALLPVLSLVLVGVWFALTVGVTRLNRTLTENASEQVGGE